MQKNIINGISIQQKNAAKNIQKKTIKIIEEWKKEQDFKILQMEKRIISSFSKLEKKQLEKNIQLSYFQFIIIIVFLVIMIKYFS